MGPKLPDTLNTICLLSFSHDCLHANTWQQGWGMLRDQQGIQLSSSWSLASPSSTTSILSYITRWVQSYLTPWTQYILLEVSSIPVVSRVSQGAVLGPLPFLIYINDVTCVVSNEKYAGDIALYQIIHSPNDLCRKTLILSVDQNSLLLNTLKCCYLLFSRKPIQLFLHLPC